MPQPKAERETPAEVEVATKTPDVVVVEAETNVSDLIQEVEPKLPSVAVSQAKRQSPQVPQSKVETKMPDVVAESSAPPTGPPSKALNPRAPCFYPGEAVGYWWAKTLALEGEVCALQQKNDELTARVEQVEAKLKKKSGWMLRCAILTNNFEPSSQ